MAAPAMRASAASATFSRSSSSTRSAVFLPMPGTRANAAAFCVATAAATSAGVRSESTDSATFGPTRVTPMRRRNISRSAVS